MIESKYLTWRWLRHLLWIIPSVLIGVLLLLFMAFWYGTQVHDWTVYSFRFDDEAFRTIEPGDSIDTLVSKVGSPLRMNCYNPQAWHYDGFRIYFDAKDRAYVKVNDERVEYQRVEYLPLLSNEEVLRQFGEPYPDSWQYDGFRVDFNSWHAQANRLYIKHPDGSETSESLDKIDRDTVRQLYGEPLSVIRPSRTYLQVWEYTQPGHLGRWADVTWHNRAVKVDLREYRVVDIMSQYVRGGDPTDHPLDMRKPPFEQPE